MKIKISQIWSKFVKKWSTACDFLTGGRTRTDFYRWLSRRMYGLETRVIKTRTGGHFVQNCKNCPCHQKVEIGMTLNKFYCPIKSIYHYHDFNNSIDPACELHFRTPVLLQILPVILAAIGVAAIIVTACLMGKYK